ncbi:MAG TPA: DUF1326 domain-containing protein [Candidatus Acidoferrum sp.]|jgi:hypothetical protein|nr:DUF1326 domain-containing protein [Candidatus Acidoferrum sp.]
MRRLPRVLLLSLLALAASLIYFTTSAQEKSSKPEFDMTASYIEACSCDMFCPCYFNTHSTNHMDEHQMDAHFCRANLVLKVDKGYYKDTKLDGAKVWIATDLGSDWSTGKDSWLVVNFDPSVSKEQQAALADILGQLYPIPWQKKGVDTAAFSWNVDTKAGVAHAKMDSGKAEVLLERVKGDKPSQEVVVNNLKYWGAQSNDGFRMWKSQHEAFEGDGHKFSYDGTNGFLITIHFSGLAKSAAAD